MKLVDVINELRGKGLNNGGSIGKHAEIYDIAADLLEKHIPKKVKPITRTIQKFKSCICSCKREECEHLKEMDGHFEYTDYVCPTCGALVCDNGTPKYCWRCGQEFTWEKGGFISDEINITKHKA